MSTEEKHTPTPWRVCGGYTEDYIAISGAVDDLVINGMAEQPNTETARANAAFIVKACNAYEGLVAENERLRRLLASPCRFPTMQGPCGACENCVAIDKETAKPQ